MKQSRIRTDTVKKILLLVTSALVLALCGCSGMTVIHPDVDFDAADRIAFSKVDLPVSPIPHVYGEDDYFEDACAFFADAESFSTWFSVATEAMTEGDGLAARWERLVLDWKARRYDESFFADHVLVFVDVWASSGSFELDVWRVYVSEGILTVAIETRIPETGTCDMALHRFAIECETDDEIVSVAIRG